MEEPGACTSSPSIGDSCNNLFPHLFCRRGFLVWLGFLVFFGRGFFFCSVGFGIWFRFSVVCGFLGFLVFSLVGFGFLGGGFGLA